MSEEQQTELDIARLISSGELPSPQRMGAMWLFDMRVTGTGTAYRQKIDQFVYREPENYLNDEFLARCNGLPVIWEHPENLKLNSEEYAARSVGAIMLPYIKDQEVWGIARVYDDDVANKIIENDLSTSPSVIFSRILENSNILIHENEEILIEDIPIIIDHLAICEIGVWDKGDDPSGISVNNPEAKEMAKENEEIKADDDLGDAPASEAEVKEDVSLDEKILAIVKQALAEHSGGTAKADDDNADPLKMPDAPMPATADSEEKETAYADSVEVAKLKTEIADLRSKMPKHRTDDEYDQLAIAQARAEKHYMAFGDSAAKCRPMDGETVIAYRKRMAKGLQKHSAKFSKINIGEINDPAMMEIAEESIYADSMAAAMSPVSAGGDFPRPVVTEEGGRKRTEWVGGKPGIVFAPFRMQPRQLAALQDHTKH